MTPSDSSRDSAITPQERTMNDLDVRWIQCLANYLRALAQLSAPVDLAETRALSELERQGLIQAFEFTHELAWNVIKDYFAYQRQMGDRFIC